VSKQQPKLTVTVGERYYGTTVIDGEFPISVTWKLGITNYMPDYDEDGFETTTYSDRFVANPSKKVLGKLYKRIRDAAIEANRLQRIAELMERDKAANAPNALRAHQREYDDLKAQATADGVTILLNQADIDDEAKKASEPDVDIADVLGGGQQV
jgi:hypothetical protein